MIEFFQILHSYIFDQARLPVGAAALVIVAIGGLLSGALGSFAGPFYWRVIDFLFGTMGGKMDKPGRTVGDLAMRGFILCAFVMAFSFLIGRAAHYASVMWPDYRILETILLVPLLAGGALWRALFHVKQALDSDHPIKGAFRTIAVTSRSDLLQNDDFTITRIGMGLAVRLFDKGMVAPVFWFLIGGLPAAYLYAGLAAYAWRFGKDGHGRGFANIGLALEKLMGFVPSLLSGIIVTLAALFTPTAQMSRALGGVKMAPYDEGGWPVSAAAYGMNVTLGGATRDLDGAAIHRAWVGPKGASAQLGAAHIHRALYLGVMSSLLWLATLIGAIVVSGNMVLTF